MSKWWLLPGKKVAISGKLAQRRSTADSDVFSILTCIVFIQVYASLYIQVYATSLTCVFNVCAH